MNRKALIKRLLVLRQAAKRSSRSRYLHIRHRSEGRLATVEYLLRYMEARSNKPRRCLEAQRQAELHAEHD